MEILQFTLLASELVWRGRIPFFAINSNRFGKPWEFDEGVVGWDENGKEITRIRKENGPSRKIFRMYLKELLKERLLTRIETKDKRSKYYSITPLGIVHLIKYGEDEFYFDYKYRWPERINVIQTLQTFAQQNVKPYKSIIFGNEKFFQYDTDLWDWLAKWLGMSLRNLIPHVFTNVEITQEHISSKYIINMLEFFVTNGHYKNNKVSLVHFDFKIKEFVNIKELNRPKYTTFGRSYKDSYELQLDDVQFHHYLANLMLCSLIYDYGMLLYDLDKKRNRKQTLHKKINTTYEFDWLREDTTEIPEYVLKILILFSKHVFELTKEQYELSLGFKEEIHKIQFIKH